MGSLLPIASSFMWREWPHGPLPAFTAGTMRSRIGLGCAHARCAALGLAVALSQGQARAQAEETHLQAMTLKDAIAYARTHQPVIRASLARVASRRAESEIPRAQWSPVIGVTGQIFAATANNTTGTYVSPTFMDVPRIGATTATSRGTFQPYASTYVGVGGAQEIFDFGRIAAQSAAADALVDVEAQLARVQTLDVTFDVEEAYFAVFANKAMVSTSEDAFERARVHRDMAKAGVVAGLRPPIELTRAEADLTRFDLGRIRARGGLAVAQAVFAAAVGVPDAALDVSGAAPPPEEMPALTKAIQEAAARDPRILETFAQLKAQEERTRAIGAELRPDVSLTGALSGRAGGAPASGIGTIPDGSGFLPTVPNWSAGIVFTWPLFEPTVSARKQASQANEQARREEIAVAKQQQVAAIRVAYGGVTVARASLPGLLRAVDAARANYAQADARFGAGLGTSVELADAEMLRTDAEIQFALGQFEVARARASFGRSIAEGI